MPKLTFVLITSAGCFLLLILILTATASKGIVVNQDSQEHLRMAEIMQKSFWQGDWIYSGSFTPMYPLVLVCLTAVADSNLLSAARWLHLFIACFIYILAAILLRKIIQNQSVMFFAAIMMSFSIPFFANAISLGEEALFILLMLIYLHVLLKKEYSAKVNFWLIILTIISCLTSQTGFCLIPVGGFFLLLFSPGRLRYRFKRMIIYFAFTIIPWGLLLTLNKMISSFMINNLYQYKPLILLRANFLVKTLISWFLPWRSYPGLTLLITLIVILIMTLLCYKKLIPKIRENDRLLLSLSFISALFVLVFLINPDAGLSNVIRNISPLYLPLLVLLLIVMDSFWDMVKEKGKGGIINTLLISVLLLILTLQPIAQILETIKIMGCDSCDLDKIRTTKQLEGESGR